MMRPGTKVKIPVITSAPAKIENYRDLMGAHAMPAGRQDADDQHQWREYREQMDGTPGAPEPVAVGMNEKRRGADRQLQHDPNPSDCSMGYGALGCRKLDDTKHKRRHRAEGMNLNFQWRAKQRSKAHELLF